MNIRKAKNLVAAVAMGVVVCFLLRPVRADNPNARLQTQPTKKEKFENRGNVVAVMQAMAEPTERDLREPAKAKGRAASPTSLTHSISINTNHSWDAYGAGAGDDPDNEVIVYDLAAALGFSSGTPLTMTGIGWDVTIDTIAPGQGSWRSEAISYFDDNIAPDASGLFLSPGVADTSPGTSHYTSGGIVDLTDNSIPDIFLPNGVLRIYLYEDFDDLAGAIDANYFAGGFPASSFTIEVDDPTATGACCNNSTSVCAATNTLADCNALGGHTWYTGEDCSIFVCPDVSGNSCAAPKVVDFATDLPYSDMGQTTCGRGNDHQLVAPDCLGSYDQGEEIIYELVVPSDTCVNIIMTSDASWTGMGVHNVCPPTLGCTFSTSSAANQSIMNLNLAAGTHYLQIDTWPAPTCIGSFDLSITECPSTGACCDDTSHVCAATNTQAACDGLGGHTWYPGEDCSVFSCPVCADDSASVGCTTAPHLLSGSTVGAGNDCPQRSAQEEIWEVTITESGLYNFKMDTNAPGGPCAFDSFIYLMSDCCSGTVIRSNDDCAGIGCFGVSCLTCVPLDPGTYYLVVEGFGAADAGDYVVTVDCCLSPGNDLCDDATDIPAVPYQDNGVAVAAATDDANVDPSCDSGFSCGTGPANNGVWYTYTPPVSCTANISSTGMDSAKSIWTGPDCNNLSQEFCSDPEAFSFPMAGGTTYWILVSNWSCSSEPAGPLNFSFDCVPLPSGACCTQGVGMCDCAEVPSVDCAGTYLGDLTTCAGPPNPCDCNSNGICDADDLLPGAADTYTANPNIAIPDNAGPLESLLAVPAGVVADVNVSLVIDHSWVGDLCVALTHPSGTPTVQLIQRPGMAAGLCDNTGCCGCSGDDYNVVLDDAGTGGAIEGLCGSPNVPTSPPSYTPDQLLSAFNGMAMLGDWKLTVNDNATGDTGTLVSWSLHFNAAAPFSEDCNTNGVPDECDVADGTSEDCNNNGIPDECDVADGTSEDCNANGIPDECDVASGTSEDCQGDGIPDECQLNTSGRLILVQDGGFEAGSPNPFWTEFSASFGTPLCTTGLCGFGGGTGPNSGTWWAWFGGIQAPETGYVEQLVNIPAGGHALTFQLEIPVASGNGVDFMRVEIDGNIVYTALENLPGHTTYAPVSVDITPYAGALRMVRFYSEVTGAVGLSNFFVDDVDIVSTGPPANDCNVNGVPDECDAPVCGNDCVEGGVGSTAEECDGTDDSACPGECYPAGHPLACTCFSCGDGFVNPGEDCDGGDCCTANCTFDDVTVCRLAVNECDVTEVCDGTSADCPTDAFQLAGVDCTDDGNECTSDVCDGTANCTHPINGLCGACCLPNGTCNDQVQEGTCESLGGTFIVAGSNCGNDSDGDGIDDLCDQCPGVDDAVFAPGCVGAIPTTSQWGLVVLAMLLLIGGKLYFGRRTAVVG